MRTCLTVCYVVLTAITAPFAQGRDNPLDQGGETCADATLISGLPFCDTGTTAGHVNNYTPPCMASSTAPDVVYRYTPPVGQTISVSLCGSAYNTVLHIWRGCPTSGGVLVCCNDNTCGLQSCCPGITLVTGQTYYFIVDGYGGESGNYLINVISGQGCPNTSCTPPTCPYPDRDVDPSNNVCGTALPQITCGDTSCGEINPSNDVDWYLLNIAGPQCATAVIDVFADDTPGWFPFGGGLDPKIALFAADCITMLAQDDNGGTGNDAHLVSGCLTPGTYRVRVDNYSTTAPGGPYILAVACTACQCPNPCVVQCPSYGIPENEPCPNFPDNFNGGCNSNPPVFSPIQCGQTICGTADATAGGGRDTDWYALSLTAPDSVIWCVQAEFPVEVMIMQPGGAGCTDRDTIAYATALPCSMACVSACLAAGSYVVYVAPTVASGLECSDYVAHLTCTQCLPPDTCPYPSQDIEPNNTCASGTAMVSCGSIRCGNLTSGDGDYYTFQVPLGECRVVTIDIFGNDTPGWYPFGRGLDPNVCVYDATCSNLIGCDYSSGTGNDAHLVTACLPGGTYKFRVGTDAAIGGPYILQLSCQACQCTPGACPYVSHDVEPANNTCGASDPPATCPDTLCGEIQLLGDDDWYTLSMPTTPCGQITIDIYANDTPGWWPFGQGLNPRVWLYAGDCVTELAFDDNGGTGNDAHLVAPCHAPGTFYVHIDGTGAVAPTTGPYIMVIHCTSCQCPEPCQIQCNGTPENEPCPNVPDNYNGGCTTFPPHFQPIANDQTVCGTSSAGELTPRDEDWFSFTLDWPSMVIWCVTAEFPVQIGLYAPGPNGCLDLDTIACGSALACVTACVSECLPPGNYAVSLAPDVPGVLPCSNYEAHLAHTICTPAVCEAPDSLIIQVPTAASPDIHLLWPAVPGADRYYVYRSTDPTAPPSAGTYLGTATVPSFVDTGVIGTPPVKYFYTVTSHCPYPGCP